MKTQSLQLDKPREIKFNFAAFLALDEQCGLNAMDPATYRSFTPKQAVALVWAGQLHTAKPLSREQVAEHIPTDADEFVTMMTIVSESLGAALGAKANEKS